MNDFLLDLLHDLREKRLAPVAIGLLVALVAVPLVLMKSGGEDPGAGTPPPAGASATSSPTIVQSVEDGPGGGSNLGVFDPKDPFKSGVKVKKPQAADGIAQLVNPAPSSGGSSGGSGGPPPTGVGTDLVPGNVKPPVSGSPPSAVRPITRSYTYVVDVKFGQTGDERTRKGVKRLGILPNDRNPIVVFLGASSDAKRAVFLVDSRVSQSGEGVCRPTVKSCTFLYLRDTEDRDEQFLTDANGREYHLTLLGIRRVEIKKSTKKKAGASDRRSSARDARARAMALPRLAPDLER